MPFNLAGLTRADTLRGANTTDTEILQSDLAEARKYLRSFSWCKDILATYIGLAEPGILMVAIHNIRPGQPGVDDWLWTVTGDLPPAYLVTDDARTPEQALEAYIGEMRAWVDAIQFGQPTEDLIPVNVPATSENAALLKSRLEILERFLSQPDDSEEPQ